MNLKIFAELIDDQTKEQILEIASQDHYKDQKIRIMPDCHLGKGSCIGYTQEVTSPLINPAFVGVDIGCGVGSFLFKTDKKIDFRALDEFIKNNIPSGFAINKNTSNFDKQYNPNIFPFHDPAGIIDICDSLELDYEKVKKSLGSLGGGNHFIELGKDETEGIYALTVHTGSRNFGLKVAEHYINMSKKYPKKEREKVTEKIKILARAEREGNYSKIQSDILTVNSYVDKKYPKGMIDLEESGYINDMLIVQKFAKINRYVLLSKITDFMIEEFGIRMSGDKCEYIDTPHNYVDKKTFQFMTKKEDRIIILRKGAISANIGETVLIPFNMRDGIILAKGKGNSDWNYSAPHGAGRILSRTKANEQLKDSNVNEIMKGIYTSTAQECIDELPDAYKPIDKILSLLNETVDVIRTFKPLYNFKAKN